MPLPAGKPGRGVPTGEHADHENQAAVQHHGPPLRAWPDVQPSAIRLAKRSSTPPSKAGVRRGPAMISSRRPCQQAAANPCFATPAGGDPLLLRRVEVRLRVVAWIDDQALLPADQQVRVMGERSQVELNDLEFRKRVDFADLVRGGLEAMRGRLGVLELWTKPPSVWWVTGEVAQTLKSLGHALLR